MTGRILTFSSLVALVQAKAIITNNCPQPVYLWSVPSVGSAAAENLPINPGSRYEEPWRFGTSEHPGIALKISPNTNGIHQGMDEINFAYSVERADKSKVWVDLTPIRGQAFDNNLAFHTCHGAYYTLDAQTRQCEATDDIELVLCGTERTSPAKDPTSPQMISDCFDYHHDGSQYDEPNGHSRIAPPNSKITDHSTNTCGCSSSHTSSMDGSYHKPPKHTFNTPSSEPSVYTSSLPYHEPHKHTSSKPYHEPPKYASSVPYHEPSKYTSSALYHKPPKDTSSKPFYEPHKYSSTEPHYKPPTHTSDKPYFVPPKYTMPEPYSPPLKQTTTTTTVTKYTTVTKLGEDHTVTYHVPPKYTSEEHYQPPKHTPELPYSPPLKHTSEMYRPPPKHTSEIYRSPPPHTTARPYPPPPSIRPYAPPPRYTSTSVDGYHVPQRPSYHPPSDRPARPTKPTYESIYHEARPILRDGDIISRRSPLICQKKVGNEKPACEAPQTKPHDHCKPKIVYLKPKNQLGIRNDTLGAPQSLATVPLKTVVQHQAEKHSASSSHAAQPNGKATVSPSAVAKTKRCILPFCEPIHPLNCAAAAKTFEAEDKNEVEWSVGDDVCQNLSKDGTGGQHNAFLSSDSPLPFKTVGVGRPRVCIKPLCLGLTRKACEDLEDLMERSDKDNGNKVDYTTDDDVCGKVPASRNATSSAHVKSRLNVRRVKPIKEAQKVCVLPFCKGLDKETCQGLERDLAQVVKGKANNIAYTTEEDVCNMSRDSLDNKGSRVVDAMLARTRVSPDKRGAQKVCVQDICHDFHLSPEECKAFSGAGEVIFKLTRGTNVAFGTAKDVCASEMASQAVNSTMV